MKREFIPFPKLPRLSREVVITEKIDGTNASVFIGEDGEIIAGSRTRWIKPNNDNFGFAAWVEENKDDLMNLGVGHHFGEWWGRGIQRGYDSQERRFSLFNTTRWNEENTPDCCNVVPVLYVGPFEMTAVNMVMKLLDTWGSEAKKGFMNPEGIVIWHAAAGVAFKKTIEKDELHKSQVKK